MYKRVVIIEDNTSTLRLLSDIVKKLDSEIEVLEFHTMDGVYEAVLENTIDLFLVDIVMNPEDRGDISGIRFADRIRTIEKYEFTPIIFITSLEDPKLYAYSELHCFAYLEKPFDTENIKETVKRALRFPSKRKTDGVLFFRREGILFSVKCSEILYIENSRHRIYVHRLGDEIMEIPYRPLKQILKDADNPCLLQCSRSMVINKEYVDSIDFANRYIMLKGVEVPVNIGSTYLKRVGMEFRYGE